MTPTAEQPQGSSGLSGKNPIDSVTVMNELVLPNDTNVLNNLMGGRLLHWMDICAAITAQKHSSRTVVTASVDNVSFQRGIRLGNLVTLTARVTRAFHTSMEVHLEVWAENIPARERFRCNEAYFTFVAVDHSGHPIQVPEIIPQNESEQKLFDEALKRRQLRLVLAGRMKPSEANELKTLFI
jgi:acyl-CoA hydrolase